MPDLNPNFHDGTLQQGQAFAAVTQTVLLQADNVTIDPATCTFIYIGSNNTTASNRTFTLNASVVGAGHSLTLEFNTGASTTAQLADSGNCKLVAAWEPVQFDTLTLMYDGTYWVEVARGTSSGGNPIVLADGQILVGNASNVATAVAMSGDIAITNAGVTSIASGVIVNADVNGSAAIAYSKLAALTSAQVLVGSVANVATAVAMTGDVTISNTGVTAVGADKVTVTMLNSGVMVEATGTLSQANIIAMGVTPVTLVANPAAGVALIVDEVEILHTYSTAVYTGGGDVALEYADGTNVVLYADTLVTGGSSLKSVVKPTIYDLDSSTGTATGFAIVAAQGLQITNVGGAFAAGNAANILKWRVRYHLLTLLA